MSVQLCSFLFFKQKTAFELRISDWGFDVGSSDLADGRFAAHLATLLDVVRKQQRARAGTRGRQRRLGAGVAAADDDDVVVVEGVGHAFAGRRAGLALAQLCARPQNGADILGACRRPRRATEVGTLPASCPRAPGVASARGRRLEIGTGPAKRTTG